MWSETQSCAGNSLWPYSDLSASSANTHRDLKATTLATEQAGSDHESFTLVTAGLLILHILQARGNCKVFPTSEWHVKTWIDVSVKEHTYCSSWLQKKVKVLSCVSDSWTDLWSSAKHSVLEHLSLNKPPNMGFSCNTTDASCLIKAWKRKKSSNFFKKSLISPSLIYKSVMCSCSHLHTV